MSLDIVCVKEVQHSDLSLIALRSINGWFFIVIVDHLDFGIIVQNNAALDDLSMFSIHQITVREEFASGTTNKIFSHSHYTSCENAGFARAYNIGIGKVLIGLHMLH